MRQFCKYLYDEISQIDYGNTQIIGAFSYEIQADGLGAMLAGDIFHISHNKEFISVTFGRILYKCQIRWPVV